MVSEPATFLPEHFINRELSWLEFNARVLEEAQDATNPLLERVKFLSIFSSNLDEFFMVRVAGLREQAFGGVAPQDAAGRRTRRRSRSCSASPSAPRSSSTSSTRCWNESILPALAAAGIRIHRETRLRQAAAARSLDEFFRQRAFPVLTPMAIDPSHPSPRFHNRGLYLAALLKRVSAASGPTGCSPSCRCRRCCRGSSTSVEPDENRTSCCSKTSIACQLPELFGGYEIVDHATFRLTRDMDIDLLEQESDDMLRAIESRLRARQHSEAVRLEVSAGHEPRPARTCSWARSRLQEKLLRRRRAVHRGLLASTACST